MPKPSTSAKPPVANDDRLKGLRVKVQVLKRQVPALADDEDAWRAFLARHAAGQTSTRAMSESDLRKVVTALHDAGAPRTAGKGAGRDKIHADDAQSRLIRALWLALADAGAVHTRSEAALDAFVRRTSGAQTLRWATVAQRSKVAEALKSWCQRVGVGRPDTPRPPQATEVDDG